MIAPLLIGIVLLLLLLLLLTSTEMNQPQDVTTSVSSIMMWSESATQMLQ